MGATPPLERKKTLSSPPLERAIEWLQLILLSRVSYRMVAPPLPRVSYRMVAIDIIN